MSRLPRALAVLIALWLPPTTVAAAAVGPICIEHGPDARICSLLDESALSRPGDSTTWRVWVEGKNAPLQVRLHNSTPQRFRVRGGDDQIVHLGCRPHRAVRRRVVALAPALVGIDAPARGVTGEPRLRAAAADATPPPQLDVRSYSPVPRQEAAAIAAAIAPRLAAIEAGFLRRRGELPAVPSAEAVNDLIDDTERDLVAALNYGELAPLREYVAAQFRRARAALTAAQRAAGEAPRARPRRVVYVLFDAQSAPPTAGGPGWADPALDFVQSCIRKLRGMSDAHKLTTNLCVTSTPTGATTKMRLRATRQWLTDKRTTGWYPQLYRGHYVYSVRRGLKTIRCLDPEREACGPLDLVESTEPVFHCDFASGVCERRSPRELPEECHAERE